MEGVAVIQNSTSAAGENNAIATTRTVVIDNSWLSSSEGVRGKLFFLFVCGECVPENVKHSLSYCDFVTEGLRTISMFFVIR